MLSTHYTQRTAPALYHPVQLSRPPFTCIRCKAIVTSIRRAEWKENAIPARWHFNVKLNSRSVPTHATLSILPVSATLLPPTYTHTHIHRQQSIPRRICTHIYHYWKVQMRKINRFPAAAWVRWCGGRSKSAEKTPKEESNGDVHLNRSRIVTPLVQYPCTSSFVYKLGFVRSVYYRVLRGTQGRFLRRYTLVKVCARYYYSTLRAARLVKAQGGREEEASVQVYFPRFSGKRTRNVV